MATGDKPPSLDADVDMADLASLDAPAATSAAAGSAPSTRFRPKAKGKPRPKAEPPKPVPVAVPKPEPEPQAVPVPEPDYNPAPPPEDMMEVDGAVDAPGHREGAEEEDFVVREIDVYFNPKPFEDDTKLYIMQYPLRPCWRPYELNELCEEVRMKPLSSEVEVDLSINTHSENYDQEAPLRLTKQTLSSSKAADVTDYAVGVLKGNLVHLNHIDAVVQMRPSMSHVSGRAHSRQASQPQEMNGGSRTSMDSSRKGNERREDSKDQAEDSEPWISLTYQPAGSNTATKYHDKMISNEGGPIDFTMSTSDYLTSLCPGASTSSKHINKCQAIREMLLLPLEERLKKWFTEVSVVNQFDALKHLAPTCSEVEILKMLPEYAYLVRGLWVCKSSLLLDGVYSRPRDRILLEFTKRDPVPSNILDPWIELIDERFRKRILLPLCKKREFLKDYKFISADLSFLKRYPHIVNEQECAWSARETTLCESQEMSTTLPRKSKSLTRSNVASKGPHSNMSKGRDGPSQGSDDFVQSVLGTVFTANKVRSMQAVVRDLRQLAAKYASDRKDGSKLQALCNAAKSCASLPHDELEKSIHLVAASVHGVFVAKHERMRTLRNVFIFLFRHKEPNAKLTKQEVFAAAAKHLKREITPSEYHQVVNEICISTNDGDLLLKNGDEP